jgi:hypothetical protein
MERGIYGLFGKVGAERGTITENKVMAVFERRIKERDCPEWLIGCKQANEKEDRRGIDFWFKTKDVGNIRIQVKSSMKGVEEAKKHHPKIPVVRLPPGSSENSLFRECLGVVEQERIKYLLERR